MTRQLNCVRLGGCLAESRSGVTSLLFAIMMIPLILILGIAIDFGFYLDASSKLNLAADAAAMHAVRAASMAASNNTTYSNAGQLAGEEWFAAQAEVVPGVTLTGPGVPIPVTVNVTYAPPTYSATVTYTGTMTLVFGRIVGITTWPIAGTATSTISNSFVDFGIMIDNSQSMLIGATPSDIAAMELATPCAVVKPNPAITGNNGYPGLDMRAYSYHFNGPTNPNTYPPFPWDGTIGYVKGTNTTLPTYTGFQGKPTNPTQEFCDPNLVGGCAYPPGIIYGPGGTFYTTPALSKKLNIPVGACNNFGGAPGLAGNYTPQAPCAFACHQNADGGDWYALARNTINPSTNSQVQLRLDIVQRAAQSLLKTMQTYSKPPQTLLNVGIYLFNNSFQPAYPCTSSGCVPFGDDLNAASSILNPCIGSQTTGCLLPPVTNDNPNTDIPDVFAQAANFLKGSEGNGQSQATAYKNLFIITDGVSDWPLAGQQIVGPIDQLVANPCQQLKDQGFTIYVLYTPYQPLETWTYSYWLQAASPVGTYPAGNTLQNFVTQPSPNTDSPVQAALRACASYPTNFYTANDASDINAALQKMLATALNSAARVTN